MSPHSTCDLHLHTFYSDGRPSPQEVVQHAASIGLRTIAITDHDTAQGAREAIGIAAHYSITVIPAIEFTCRWDACNAPLGKTDIDVLGYFVDLDHPTFRAREQAALADHHARTASGCALLSAAGYPITLNDVFVQNPRYACSIPLIQALIHKGYAGNWRTAVALIDTYWSHVRPSASTIDQIIATIHAASGVAVLAHPTIIPWPTGWLPAEALATLVEMGLDGIEIYHDRLDPAARAHFLSLAQQFDLLVTGGSDEHGWAEDEVSGAFLVMGRQPVTEAMVDALARRASYHPYEGCPPAAPRGPGQPSQGFSSGVWP